MTIKNCWPYSNLFTVFETNEDIPKYIDAVEFEGDVFQIIVPLDYKKNTLAINGAHDMLGKNVTFMYKGETVNE